jgi:hypothetical protein
LLPFLASSTISPRLLLFQQTKDTSHLPLEVWLRIVFPSTISMLNLGLNLRVMPGFLG